MGSKRGRSRRQGRFCDSCANAQNLEQLTIKERVAVAASLGYHTTIISTFYTIEELSKKHRYGLGAPDFDPATTRQGIEDPAVSHDPARNANAGVISRM